MSGASCRRAGAGFGFREGSRRGKSAQKVIVARGCLPGTCYLHRSSTVPWCCCVGVYTWCHHTIEASHYIGSLLDVRPEICTHIADRGSGSSSSSTRVGRTAVQHIVQYASTHRQLFVCWCARDFMISEVGYATYKTSCVCLRLEQRPPTVPPLYDSLPYVCTLPIYCCCIPV